MPYDEPLYSVNFLQIRRDELGVTLEQMAVSLGYQQSMRGKASQWERGFSKPPSRRRELFLQYLADTLHLRSEPLLFAQYWNVIEKEWGWSALSSDERQRFLSKLPAEVSDETLSSSAFTDQIKMLCEVSGASVVIAQSSLATANMFLMLEERSFRRSHNTLVICLDNSKKEVSEGYIQFLKGVAQKIMDETSATSTLFVTKTKLSTDLRDAVGSELEVQTEVEMVRGLINFEKYLRQIRTDFEQGDNERFGNIPLAQGFVELTAQVQKPSSDVWSFPEQKLATEAVSDWLAQTHQPLAIVFGGYGTGKSTLSLKIAYDLAVAYQGAEDKSGLRIPIIFPLRVFPKSTTVDLSAFVATYLKSHCRVDNPDPEAFRVMNDAGLFLLIFDGFDEMAVRTDSDIIQRNFYEILQLITSSRNKILVTSRPELFFDSEEEEEVLASVELLSFEGAKSVYEMTLAPFTDAQIKQFLEKRYPKTWRQYYSHIQNVVGLQDIASRPVLLEVTLTALPDVIREGGKATRSRLYDMYISKELSRQKQLKKRDFLIQNREQRFLLTQAIASHLYKTGESEMSAGEMQKILIGEFSEHQRSDIEAHVRDFIACSFMSRDENKYGFSHRSFLEYLTAKTLAREIENQNPNFFRECRLTLAVRDWLVDLWEQTSQSNWVAVLWEWLNATKKMTSEEAKFLGGNSLTLLHSFGESLHDIDFSNAKLGGAQLEQANCRASNFSRCNLEEASFVKAVCPNATFEEANLANTLFNDANLDNASFRRAHLVKATLTGASLASTDFRNAHLANAILRSARFGGTRYAEGQLEKHVRSHKMFAGAVLTDVSFTTPRRRESFHCFVAGTTVMMKDGRTKNIEDVTVEEKVFSFDFDANEFTESVVTEIYRAATKTLIIMNNTLRLTPSEAVYTLDGWIVAEELVTGSQLRTVDGIAVVESLEKIAVELPVYNLTVSPYHNFFAEGILVHNMPRGYKRPIF